MPFELVVPDLGESVTEATVARWTKQEGEAVAAGEVVVELETDKANMEIAAEKPGKLVEIKQVEGADVRVGEILGLVDESAAGETRAAAVERPEEPAPEPIPVPEQPAPQPDKGDEQVERPQPPPSRRPEEPAPPPEKPEIRRVPPKPEIPASEQAGRTEERVRMSRRRRTIAARLVEAQHAAAMLTTFNEVDMSAVMDIRKRRKEGFEKKNGVSLGLTSFFVKAAIGALKQFPRLNAEVDGDEMIIKHYYDIGIAIGDPEGLVVPVLRRADRLSFAEIEKSVRQFVEQAETGSLSIEDLRGGTFTITNGGVFGSLMSTPILNPPQVGILGLHRILERAVVENGEIVVRPMMYLALSYDHRLVDGRESVSFLVRLKQLVEDPARLMLEV